MMSYTTAGARNPPDLCRGVMHYYQECASSCRLVHQAVMKDCRGLGRLRSHHHSS